MQQRPKRVEASGTDVEQAIAAGLARLGLTRDEVEVEVLSEGSHGLFGLRARPAIVRLTPRVAPAGQSQPVSPAPTRPPRPAPPPPEQPTRSPVEIPVREAPAPPETSGREVSTLPDRSAIPATPKVAPVDAQLEQAEHVGRDTLSEILGQMHIKARVRSHWSEAEGDTDARTLILDVMGDDLGILIGRRGETLEALQYITRLIVSRELQRRCNLVIDVEGYKARREQYLRRLAARTAEQVMRSHRTVALEPMLPAERRVIHLTLREHPQVATESIGEGESRRVTVFLKEARKQA